MLPFFVKAMLLTVTVNVESCRQTEFGFLVSIADFDVTVRTFGSVRFGSAEVQRCFLAAVEVQANFAFIFCLSQQEPLNKSNSC